MLTRIWNIRPEWTGRTRSPRAGVPNQQENENETRTVRTPLLRSLLLAAILLSWAAWTGRTYSPRADVPNQQESEKRNETNASAVASHRVSRVERHCRARQARMAELFSNDTLSGVSTWKSRKGFAVPAYQLNSINACQISRERLHQYSLDTASISHNCNQRSDYPTCRRHPYFLFDDPGLVNRFFDVLRNQTLLFVGDSVTEQHYADLSCRMRKYFISDLCPQEKPFAGPFIHGCELVKQSYAIRHFKLHPGSSDVTSLAMYGLYVTNSTEVEQPSTMRLRKRGVALSNAIRAADYVVLNVGSHIKSARQLNDTLYAFHKVYLRARKPSAVLMIREEQPVAFETPSGRYEEQEGSSVVDGTTCRLQPLNSSEVYNAGNPGWFRYWGLAEFANVINVPLVPVFSITNSWIPSGGAFNGLRRDCRHMCMSSDVLGWWSTALFSAIDTRGDSLNAPGAFPSKGFIWN